MSRTSAVRICVIALVCCAAVCTSLSAAPFDPNKPPELEIPRGDLTSEVVRRHRDDIQAWVKHWAKVLDTDSREALQLKARSSLAKGYTKFDDVRGVSARYYRIYADAMAENVAPLLNKPGTVRQINVALALVATPRIAMQEPYRAMVAHKNPAVRYLGWRGYDKIRDTILAQGSRASERFFQTATKAVAKESSPQLLASLWRAMRVARTVTNEVLVSDDVLENAQLSAFDVVDKGWGKMLGAIAKGNREMAYTGRMGPRAIRGVWDAVKQDKEKRTKALQNLVDLAYAAALANMKAEGAGPVAAANLLLLRETEQALVNLTTVDETFIANALNDGSIEDPALRAKAAVLAALEWASQLTDAGVTQPVDPTKKSE
jgi:hypothetical protein